MQPILELKTRPSGLYYKNITIVNDASRVICEWHHNLEPIFRSPIMLRESLIMLLESSIMLLVNVYKTGIVRDDCYMFIVQGSVS